MAPLLPGHGEQFAGMDSCLLEDWQEAVHLTYEALRRDGSPVAVVGYCLGGTLGLLSASELGPRGLAVLAAPTELEWDQFIPLTHESKYKLFETTSWVEDCSSEKARIWRKKSCHPVTTKNFLNTFAGAIAKAKAKIAEIRCPVLVASSGLDRCVPSEQTEVLLGELRGAESTERSHASGSGHAILLDKGRRSVQSDILSFLLRLDQAEQKLTF